MLYTKHICVYAFIYVSKASKYKKKETYRNREDTEIGCARNLT